MRGILHERAEELLAPHLRSGGPGAVIGVARDGAMLMRAAFGSSNLAAGAPLTPQTRLPIASVTKHMTGMAASILAEAGEIDLDAPVGKYVNGLGALVARPTLRQLMTHQSGLRCHLDVQFLSGFGVRPDGFANRTIEGMRSVNAEPGALQVYGNTGYHLMALALETVTGLGFAELMAERLLRPLGMTRTSLAASGAPSGVDEAALYAAEADGWRDIGALRHESLGEGGVSSSLDDMMAWARALRTEDPRLPKAAWSAIKQAAPTANGAPGGYGLGLVLGRHRGVEMIGHGGMIYGASSSLLIAPAHGVEIVILANINLPAEAIARDLLVAVLGEAALTPAPSTARTEDWQGVQEGLFRADALVARFVDRDGALAVSLQGSPGLPLLSDADGLWLQGTFGPIAFRLPDGPAGDRLEVRMGGETHHAVRRREPAIVSKLLISEVAGTYICAELESEMILAGGDGGITVRSRGPYGEAQGRATAIATDLLLAEIPFASFLLTLQRENGRVVALAYDTPRTRALPFLRLS